jgi:hypothetical protein
MERSGMELRCGGGWRRWTFLLSDMLDLGRKVMLQAAE